MGPQCLVVLTGFDCTPFYGPIQGCATGQGMVFLLSVLNRLQFHVSLLKRVHNFT